MKIGILPIGEADTYVLNRVQENLNMVFSRATARLIEETFQIPREAFDEMRQQHRSDVILNKLKAYADKNETLDRILGVVNIDIYAQGLNFAFGEAECPGKAALVSLWRLREEFYERRAKPELLVERTVKEAVHELGHTLGLRHCTNPFCVMYFSNSIFETDRKQSLFCSKCQEKIEAAPDEQGEHH